MRPPAPPFRAGTWAALLLALGAAQASAQTQSAEDKLREALRRSTVELRAAQDTLATLQAQLDATQKQRDALKAELDAAQAKLAAQPAVPAPTEEEKAELERLRAALQAAQKENASLQAGLRRWQSAYQEAAALARTKDEEGKRLDAALKASQGAAEACRGANTRLVAVANDILHLYRTQDFRSILLGSYEPLLGLKRVELENIVQGYEDRILAQKLYPTRAPAPAPGAPSGAPR